jgi:hypothetical protein
MVQDAVVSSAPTFPISTTFRRGSLEMRRGFVRIHEVHARLMAVKVEAIKKSQGEEPDIEVPQSADCAPGFFRSHVRGFRAR